MASAVIGAEGQGAVLDHGDATGFGQGGYRIHVAGQAQVMDRHDGLGALRNRPRDGRRADIAGLTLDIDEDGPRAAMLDHMAGGDMGLGRHDDLVPRPNPMGQQGKMQGRGAG